MIGPLDRVKPVNPKQKLTDELFVGGIPSDTTISTLA